jgi:broad specificity phosphatase PhoE
MTRVYMIRHGKPAAVWGQDGAADPGLDEAGRAQAEAAADALLALPDHERPSIVVSSPLRRCQETAAPLARRLGVKVAIEPAVAEIPTPQKLVAAERGPWLRSAFQGLWSEISGDLDYLAWRDGVAAAAAARPGAAIFSHFVALNAAISAAEGSPRVMMFEPDHASVTTFETDGVRLRLISKGRSVSTEVL